jgi:hypothetical protein
VGCWWRSGVCDFPVVGQKGHAPAGLWVAVLARSQLAQPPPLYPPPHTHTNSHYVPVPLVIVVPCRRRLWMPRDRCESGPCAACARGAAPYHVQGAPGSVLGVLPPLCVTVPSCPSPSPRAPVPVLFGIVHGCLQEPSVSLLDWWVALLCWCHGHRPT